MGPLPALCTVNMAAAALGMYFVRFFRRAFCSLIAICFWIFTRSCWTQACAHQTMADGVEFLEWSTSTSLCTMLKLQHLPASSIAAAHAL